MGPGIGNMLVDARLNRLRKKALKASEKMKALPVGSKKAEKFDKKLGKAVEKYDKIMQRRDKEYGAEMRGEKEY